MIFQIIVVFSLFVVVRVARCDFARLDAASLDSVEFRKRFREPVPSEPVVLSGLTFGPVTSMLDPKALLENFGSASVESQHILAYRAGKPGMAASKTGLSETTSLSNLMGARDSTLFLLKHEHKAMVSIAKNLSVPALLRPVQRVGPTLSFGGKNSSSPFHQHFENWFAQIHGRKYWAVSPNDIAPGSLSKVHPCVEHATKKASGSLKQCVVKEGEVLYLPPQWHHGTCNLNKFSLGLGFIGALDHLPALHYAAAIGDDEHFRGSTPTPQDLGKSDEDGKKPLHWAADRGHLPVVKQLLEFRAVAGAIDKDGSQPLHIAAFAGHVATARALIRRSGAVTARTHLGAQPLHVAASRGHDAVAGHLLKQGAEARARDSNGAQPLHMAAYEGHAKVTDLLLKRRANAGDQSEDGTTPVDLARKRRHMSLVEKLQGGSKSKREL